MILLQAGIAGQFWLAAVFSVNLLLFSIVANEFRTKAPGAKTFLQVKPLSFVDSAANIFANVLLFYM